MPGDLIKVNGILKALTLETAGAGRSNKDKCTFVFYISVNSIQAQSSASKVEASKFVKDSDFTNSDLESFQMIKDEPNVFKYIIYKIFKYLTM